MHKVVIQFGVFACMDFKDTKFKEPSCHSLFSASVQSLPKTFKNTSNRWLTFLDCHQKLTLTPHYFKNDPFEHKLKVSHSENLSINHYLEHKSLKKSNCLFSGNILHNFGNFFFFFKQGQGSLRVVKGSNGVNGATRGQWGSSMLQV